MRKLCEYSQRHLFRGDIVVCLPPRSALQHRRHPLKQPATDLTCTGRPWEWQANDVPSIVLRLSLQQEPLPRHEPLNCVYLHLLSGVSGGKIRHHPSHLHLPRESEWEEKRAKGSYDVHNMSTEAEEPSKIIQHNNTACRCPLQCMRISHLSHRSPPPRVRAAEPPPPAPRRPSEPPGATTPPTTKHVSPPRLVMAVGRCKLPHSVPLPPPVHEDIAPLTHRSPPPRVSLCSVLLSPPWNSFRKICSAQFCFLRLGTVLERST